MTKKINESIVFFAMSFAMLQAGIYVVAKFAPWFVYVFGSFIPLLIGIAFANKGTKKNNKFLMICSIIFYNICIVSFVGGWYNSKTIPIHLMDFTYLTLISFSLISIISVLVHKCESIRTVTFVGLFLMLIAVSLVWVMLNFSLFSPDSLVYSLAMLVVSVFYYIELLVAKSRNINIIMAISNGVGGIFGVFSDSYTRVLANSENEKDNDQYNVKNDAIYKMEKRETFFLEVEILLFNIMIIAVVSIVMLKFLFVYISIVDILLIILSLFMIIYALKNIYTFYKTKNAYKKGVETFATNFCVRKTTGKFKRRYIVYSYETEDGTIKEKKQQVRPSIYRIAQDLEKLPIKVFGKESSVDIGKVYMCEYK